MCIFLIRKPTSTKLVSNYPKHTCDNQTWNQGTLPSSLIFLLQQSPILPFPTFLLDCCGLSYKLIFPENAPLELPDSISLLNN